MPVCCSSAVAASFVPPKSGSAVRLFNLANDVQLAGLENSAKAVIVPDTVKYVSDSCPRLPSLSCAATQAQRHLIHPNRTNSLPKTADKIRILSRFVSALCCTVLNVLNTACWLQSDPWLLLDSYLGGG
jgi:hypothetical protein